MPSADIALTIKDGIKAAWAIPDPDHPERVKWTATLHVDDEYQPSDDTPTLLVADDGGPAILPGPWTARRSPRRPVIRLTAFAAGRTKAREVVKAAADWLQTNDNRTTAGITRIEDVSEPLTTRDRDTGAYLASITMPCIVRPIITA
jgi:hypothetical protein